MRKQHGNMGVEIIVLVELLLRNSWQIGNQELGLILDFTSPIFRPMIIPNTKIEKIE